MRLPLSPSDEAAETWFIRSIEYTVAGAMRIPLVAPTRAAGWKRNYWSARGLRCAKLMGLPSGSATHAVRSSERKS